MLQDSDSDDEFNEGRKFMNAVRFVLHHREMVRAMLQQRATMMAAPIKIEKEVVFLDPALFKCEPKVKPGVLTESAKRILRKPTHLRSYVDIMECKDILKDMSFLEKFPEEVLIKLTGAFMFITYHKNQVVMRQGHNPCAMYFIYNGLLAVRVEIKDKKDSISVAELGAGSQIGSVSLLKGIPRSGSIICKMTTHVLVLYKEDFDLIMKDYIDKEYSARLWGLSHLPSFRGVHWTPTILQIIMGNSMVKYYPKDTLILGGISESPHWTYFVLGGRCRLVKLISYVEESIRTKTVLREHKGEELSLGQTLHRKLLQICILQKGHFFAVGENLEATYILARNDVTCLLTPCILLNRYCHRNFTGRLHDELKEELPSIERILHLYSRQLVWQRYQDRYVMEMMTTKTLHPISENCCDKKRPSWNKYT